MNVNKDSVIEKYNSKGTLVYYSQAEKSNEFELRNGEKIDKYPVVSVTDGALVSVREFSSS